MTVEYSGNADPDRILPLLWRKIRPAAAKALGRRPRLTLDAVVTAAVELADAEGLATMSMSRLAKALGVGTMTLYTYVASKTELIELMIDEVLFDRGLPGPDDPVPPAWRDRIAVYAERTRAMYRAHPWMCRVSTIRPPIGPGVLADREYVLSALFDLGLSPQQLDAAALAVASFVNATTSLEVEAEQLERVTGQSNDAWWEDRMQLWEDYFVEERHPTMTYIWNSGGFDKGTTEARLSAHEFGFQRLLDGIEAFIHAGQVQSG